MTCSFIGNGRSIFVSWCCCSHFFESNAGAIAAPRVFVTLVVTAKEMQSSTAWAVSEWLEELDHVFVPTWGFRWRTRELVGFNNPHSAKQLCSLHFVLLWWPCTGHEETNWISKKNKKLKKKVFLLRHFRWRVLFYDDLEALSVDDWRTRFIILD